MSRYIVSEPRVLSKDPNAFPLLVDQDVYFCGTTYPTTITFSDGTAHPLLSGGLVAASLIEEIAAGIAAVIAKAHQGRKILLIEILEGARPFYRKVADNLAKLRDEAGFKVDLALMQVSSYTNGSQSVAHKVMLPLQDGSGKVLVGLSAYDAVLVVDDLIDAGDTFTWLVDRYLPSFQAKNIEGYFMLDKADQKRAVPAYRALEKTRSVCGVAVPNEWVVGCGPDIALPGAHGCPPLSLFRNELPGGIYAFNNAIEQLLIEEYHSHPQKVIDQLAVYIEDRGGRGE